MKKALLALVAIFGIAATASAQRPQLQLGYGGYTQMDATDMHDGGKINNAWGALTAGLNFQVAPQISVGATYTFSSASFKHSSDDAYYNVIMANARYDYWKNSIVTLYAHLGIGVDITHLSYSDDSENKAYFAFQASPVGAEVGLNNNVALFGEFGFGAQGMLQVGARYNF